MIVDAHHHFWRYTPEEYGWIGEAMASIRRDFLPQQLKAALDAAGVDAAVTVQARQSLEETDWILEFANRHEFIAGVVGWVPLTADDAAEHLDRLSTEPKLKAVRHVIQGEPDDGYALREDFNRGLSALKNYGLAYDILVVERQLPAAIDMVDLHPDQPFVLDHVAKPRIRDGVMEPWKANIRELARRENVTCKLSGMVTEAELKTWTPGSLRPYVEVVLEAFGPSRLMFGSDWPVCLAATSYLQWKRTVDAFIAELSEDETSDILGRTATRAYKLKEQL